MLLTFQKQNIKWETIKHIMFSYAGESHMVNHQREEWFMLKSSQDFNQYWVLHLRRGGEEGREKKKKKKKKKKCLILVSIIYMQLPQTAID